MKRIIFWLIVISFIFVLGVITMLLYKDFSNSNAQKMETATNTALLDGETDSTNLPILTYCELANNPEKYDGKIVRLSAKLYIGLEGSWFADPNCGLDNGAIISSKNKEVWETMEKARKQKDEELLSIELSLIVVGRFKNVVYKDCCLIAPFQFEILKVEKASASS